MGTLMLPNNTMYIELTYNDACGSNKVVWIAMLYEGKEQPEAACSGDTPSKALTALGKVIDERVKGLLRPR